MEDSFNRTLGLSANIIYDQSHVSLLYSSILLAKLPLLVIFLIQFKLIKDIFFKNKKVVPPLPPGPPPTWPILGCVPDMLRNRPADQWIHRLMKELNTDIACIQLGNSHVITVNSPEIAREFLKRHDAVFASRPETMATCIISSGNLTTALNQRGEQWKKMRRVLVSEVLSHSKMNWLLDMRNQEADNLVRFLYSQCSKTFKGEKYNIFIVL